MPDGQDEPDWETIQRLVYRADLDAIEEHSSIGHPEELNRRPGQLAAVGRFGSVLWGLQDYVETSLVISAALTVSASSTATTIRRRAHEQLHKIRLSTQGSTDQDVDELRKLVAESGADLDGPDQEDTQLRDALAQLADQDVTQVRRVLAHLGADLTFRAEANATIDHLLPSLRVNSFHQALYLAADVRAQIDLAGRMLDRIASIIEVETS